MLPRQQRRNRDSAWYHYIRFKTYLAIPLIPIFLLLAVVFAIIVVLCLSLIRLYEKARGCDCPGWLPLNGEEAITQRCPYHYGILYAKEEFKACLKTGTDPYTFLTSNNKYMRKYAKKHLKRCTRKSWK